MNEELKHSMKLLNYYNEYSTYLSSIDGTNEKYLTFKNLRFLGKEENINCYRFELENGVQIRRIIDDKYMSYEPVTTKKEYSTDDIEKIVFKEIICDKENINK